MINIAIVEDNRTDCNRLVGFLKEYERENKTEFTVYPFSDAVSFLNGYQSVYDIVFMDIEMPGMNGMKAAEKLRVVDKVVQLIFVTNMTQYAVKGYEVSALDYVLKPVDYYSFAMKIKRALSVVQLNDDRQLTISKEGMIQRIRLSRLVYAEVNGHYITYHTDEGIIVARGKLSLLEEELKGSFFARCNNYYLVNLRYVTKVEGLSVTVNGEELKMSRTKQRDFLDSLARYLGGRSI